MLRDGMPAAHTEIAYIYANFSILVMAEAEVAGGFVALINT